MENPIKVLLAEDDKLLSEVFTRDLENAGYPVIHAFDGDEALSLAKSEHPDVILLDIIMPNKNGFEVLKELQENEILKNIPVIVLSNLGEKEDVDAAIGLGAKSFLVKSDSSMNTIVAKIQEVLSPV